MTSPSIKEALELKPCPFCNGEAESDSLRNYRNISTGNLEKSAAIYCTKCNADMSWCYRETPEIEREQVMNLLTDQWNTRATLQPSGERREAIARAVRSVLMDGLESNDPGNWLVPMYAEDIGDLCGHVADAIIASGLVLDEAAIREKERLEAVAWAAQGLLNADTYVSDVPRDKAVSRATLKLQQALGTWQMYQGAVSAIRSARNGGAS